MNGILPFILGGERSSRRKSKNSRRAPDAKFKSSRVRWSAVAARRASERRESVRVRDADTGIGFGKSGIGP